MGKGETKEMAIRKSGKSAVYIPIYGDIAKEGCIKGRNLSNTVEEGDKMRLIAYN